MLLQLSSKPGLGGVGDEQATQDDTNGDREERQRADSRIPHALLLEADGVDFEKEVKDTVDETHVKGDEQKDRLEKEHSKRPQNVLLCQLPEVDLSFIRLGVQSPVSGLVPQLFRPPLQQHRRVALRVDEQPDQAEESSYDHREPSRPVPAQIRIHNGEAADNGPSDRTDERSTTEDTDSNAAVNGVPEVRQCATYDGQRC